MDVLWEYLNYQFLIVRLVHARAVDTRPFLPCREEPGDETSLERDCADDCS